MKVSIITVCFNSEKTIAETIESVLKQDYKNIEYVIKDAGSTDRTLEIISSYEKQFENRLCVIKEKDKGIYDGMNQALKKVSGDIVGFINSDDCLANSHVISKIVGSFKKHACEGVYGDLVFLDETLQFPVRNFIAHRKKNGAWHPPHPTLYLKREIYQEIGDFHIQYKIAADYDFMLRLLQAKKYRLYYIQEYLVKMRAGGVSTDGFSGYLANLKEANQVLKENHVFCPMFYNGIRILKTMWQGCSAKLFKKRIIKKLKSRER